GFTVSHFVNKFLLVSVDVVRGLTRPALTVFMLWMVWNTRCQVEDVIARAGLERLDISLAMDLEKRIVCTILYLAGLSVAWWFGDRGRKVGK
ncbi:hypothetical protein, partial [Desulfobaculum bizertense]